jgi:hypothetical protein
MKTDFHTIVFSSRSRLFYDFEHGQFERIQWNFHMTSFRGISCIKDQTRCCHLWIQWNFLDGFFLPSHLFIINFYKVNLTKKLSHTMHRKDLSNKNKVNNNTRSYMNNWNKLASYFSISDTKSSKYWKKSFTICYVKRFSKLFYMFFKYILPSSLLANSQILRSVRWIPIHHAPAIFDEL